MPFRIDIAFPLRRDALRKGAMQSLLSFPVRIILLLLAIFAPTSAGLADPADIAAASRSVVRIVLVARVGDKSYYVGHGSGFAVTPNRIVTNAHLVEGLRDDKSIVIGIIPSEGKKSFGGKLIAYSPRNDLALIALEEGRLPPMVLTASPPEDGSQVVAIGYPAAVDRAQGFGLDELVEPMAPVKTPGVISGGRTTRQFDTLLHTAALAAGNSGGPLVDNCGRVVGVNSFGSLSDGTDAEYGFAVSDREVMTFLRSAKVDFQTSSSPCRSAAELSADEQARTRAEMQRAAERQARDAARTAARRQAYLRDAEYNITATRENYMAVAALMLALSVMAAGAAWTLLDRDKRNHGIASASAAAFLLVAAVVTFLVRPSFGEAEDRVEARLKSEERTRPTPETAVAGTNICTLIPERSRIIMSNAATVELHWQADGCINDQTQYSREGGHWTRVLVPDQEETVTINSFAPETGEFKVEHFMLGFSQMEKARAIRGRYEGDTCSANPARLAELEDMQKAIRQSLPAQPNETLVYSCVHQAQPAKSEPKSPQPK